MTQEFELPETENLPPVFIEIMKREIFTENQLKALLLMFIDLQANTVAVIQEHYLNPFAKQAEQAFNDNAERVKHYVSNHVHDAKGKPVVRFEDL